jgi:outer membrane biosynthesis protein TonB
MQQQHLGGYDEREDDSLGLMGDDRLEEFATPRRRWPTAVMTVLTMAVFAGGLWYFYHLGGVRQPAPGPGGEPPLIRADDKPMKLKPDQPGGMPVPDQNVSVYEPKPGTAPVEKLLPPPEQPMPRPVPPPSAKEVATPPVPSAMPAQPAPATTPAPPQQTAAATQAPKAPPKPALAKEAPAKSAVPAGPVRIQLASLRTPEAAKEEWGRLKREHPELLGKLTAVAVKADLGDKGVWYRVQTQVFDDAAAAERLCTDLKKQNVGCSLAH